MNKIVPIEPTSEQLNRAADVMKIQWQDSRSLQSKALDIYKAMLSATPESDQIFAIPNDITEEQKLAIQSILESDQIIVSKALLESIRQAMALSSNKEVTDWNYMIEAIDKAMKG